jgi:acetyltransferase-like isoleucine patch superfamily enzyme
MFIKARNRLTRIFFQLLKIYRFKYGIVIEGDPRKIKVGRNTVINKGVILSVKWGGSIEIGDNCYIHHGVIMDSHGGKILIGDECSLNPYCVIYGHGDTKIGNGVRIATHTVIVSSNHNFLDKNVPIRQQGASKKGITIDDDVWIAAGVKVLDGVVINKGAVIGAGAVVASNVPEYAVCVGVPAKVVKYRT